MKKINIGWVSDSHCDYQQFGSPMRRRDFAFGLYTAVKSMIAAKVSAIIHTGDLFNSSRPSAEAVRALQELGTLSPAKLPVNRYNKYRNLGVYTEKKVKTK